MRKHAEKKNGLHDLMEIMLESMMVAERGEFWLKIRAIRVTDTVRGTVTAKVKNLSSVYRETVTATFIRRFLPYCAIRRRNAIDWPESFIPKDLHRNRSVMCSTRFTASIIRKPASAGWLNASVPRSTSGLKEDWRNIIRLCSWTASTSRFTANVQLRQRRSTSRWP